MLMIQKRITVLALVGVFVSGGSEHAQAEPLRNAVFTYQGVLRQNDQPAGGAYDFLFTLCDAATEGNIVAGPLAWSNVSVVNGLFTVELDFGHGSAGSPFTGERRWLDIGVRVFDPSDQTPYTVLTPRQEVMPSPHAHLALDASGIGSRPVSSAVPANGNALKWNGSSWTPGPDNDTTYTAGAGLTLSGNQFALNLTYADGRYVNEEQSNSVTAAMLQDNAVTSVKLASNSVSTVKITADAVTAGKLASDRDSLAKVSGGSMYVNTNGLVGIGTPAPERRLHVTVGTEGTAARFEAYSAFYAAVDLKCQNNTWSWRATPDSSYGSMYFVRSGSTQPALELTYDNIARTHRLYITNTDNQLHLLNTELTGQKAAAIVYNDAAGQLDPQGGITFQRRTTAGAFEANLMTIKLVNGYTGIGVLNPLYRLELPNVADNSGRARANRWDTYSSARWKRNVMPIDAALEKVTALRGVYFDWDNQHGGRRDVGFLAEEVGAVVPELVSWDADGCTAEGLAYDRITALTVEAIKQQQQEVVALRAVTQELQARLEKLEAVIVGSSSDGRDNK